MAFEIFTADTISGRRSIAVKIRKDALPGDNRSDAYSVAIANWGRACRLIGESKTVRRLPAGYTEDRTAPGWGYVD